MIDESRRTPLTPAAPPLPDGRSARWESHREERRAELIQATRRAIHHLGADASMEDIAGNAGTSKSVFYRYFGDKAGLQQAVGAVVIAAMQTSLASARATARTPREGLVNMVAAYLQMADTSPNVYSFVTTSASGDPQQPADLSGFFEAVIAMVARPLRAHLGDGSSTLLGYWPAAAIGLVRTAGELWLRTPASATKPGPEAMAEQISSWLFDGLQAQLSLPDPTRRKF